MTSRSRPRAPGFAALVLTPLVAFAPVPVAFAPAALVALVPAAHAAPPGSPVKDADEDEFADVVDAAKAARGGAGVRVGSWQVQDLPDVDGARYSESPSYEGYFQKGLDSHLVVESTLGFWRWVQEITQEGGTFSDDSREIVTTYIVPVLSAIKFYPATRPGDTVEPYAKAGVGFVLGIEDAESTGSGGLLGFSPGSGTTFATGFGVQGGLGTDIALSRAFGLTAGGRYQWLRFSEDVGGQRTYKGFGIDLGVTYRFRY